ncbi:MAG: hypothetical protein IJ783_07705, partial [Kiritimatiellae bacterium]|nr:hypothetical protein [Kiritimatiellia bacterium]
AVVSRTAESAETFASGLRRRFPEKAAAVSSAAGPGAAAAALASATVLLNGTPVGMWPRAGGCPVDPALLRADVAVFDPVYCPTPSRLVLNARKAGAFAAGGLRMLVDQAVAAQKIWNPGLEFDGAAAAQKLLPRLAGTLWRKNATKILLVGFMGAGKSTVGKILAARLGVPFSDLDSEISAAAGMPIPAIFARDGEAGFRALETRVAGDVLSRPGSEVVAAGGGFPVREENRALVRASNALALLLDAPFETHWARISGRRGRPLVRSEAETRALYDSRAQVYRSFCDFAVPTSADGPASAVAAAACAALSP